MLYREGRADGLSLFIFLSAIALLAAALLPGNVYRWSALAFLAACIFLAPGRALPVNALSVAVALLSGWMLLNAVFLTPVYSAESLYRPAALMFGFAAVAAFERTALVPLFRAGALLMAILVLIGLAQLFFGFWHLAENSKRAAATFITPNTFATAINLFLLPVVGLCATGRGGRAAYALALWLFIGLLATESRGGYLGFATGLGFIAAVLVWTRAQVSRATALRIGAGLLAVASLFAVVVLVVRPPGGPEAFGATLFSRGLNNRVGLAMSTAQHLLDNPVIGVGANMFRPLYEMTRPEGFVDTYIYVFSHNDYLQIWLEFGLLGFVLLALLVAFALRASLVTRATAQETSIGLACGAALVSVFAHALVDFPLYVPFILMVTGAYLGALASLGGDSGRTPAFTARMFQRARAARPLAKAGVLALALAGLGIPVAADVAAARALKSLLSGDLQHGMQWQALARRIEPGNPVHYWSEAVMWREHAIDSGDRAAAMRADELFASGIAANPYEIANYLDRARLNRRQPPLLEHPASPATVLEWTREAVRLRPNSLLAHAEYARALAFAGRKDEARRVVRELLERKPDLPVVRSVAQELL